MNPRTTVLEEDGTHHTGRRATNLADAFETESTTQLPYERRNQVKEQLTGKLSQQKNPIIPMKSDLKVSELNMLSEDSRTRKPHAKMESPKERLSILDQPPKRCLKSSTCHGKRESSHQLGKRPSSSPYPRKTRTPRRKPIIDPSACSAASARPSSA